MVSLVRFFISGYISYFDDTENFEDECRADDSDFRSFLMWFDKLDPYQYETLELSAAVCQPESVPASKEQKNITGKVTNLFGNGSGLVDHSIYFDFKDVKGFGIDEFPSVGDYVYVEVERSRPDAGWKAFKVTCVDKQSEWNDDDPDFRIATAHEKQGRVIGLVTEIDPKASKGSIENDVHFDFQELQDSYFPSIGDWVQAQVTEGSIAKSVRPLRKKELTGIISGTPSVYRPTSTGLISREAWFEFSACVGDYKPYRGDEVVAEVIECKRGKLAWRACKVQFLSRPTKHTFTPCFRPGKSGWVLHGDRPQLPDKCPSLPSFLPQYSVPSALARCVETNGNLLKVCPVLKDNLFAGNYAVKFSALLHLEEIAIAKEISAFQMANMPLSQRGEFLVLVVPGVSDGKPDLQTGDVVILQDAQSPSSNPEHRGFIHHVIKETGELLIKFHEKLHENFDETLRFNVAFSYSRLSLRRCHLAVQHAKRNYAKYILCCESPEVQAKLHDRKETSKMVRRKHSRSLSKSDIDSYSFFGNLNLRQKKAVIRIVRSEPKERPYVIFGPPGTGKTVTVVEAILQILEQKSWSRLLICAPSNSAVDLLCERLHRSGRVSTDTMVRFNAYRRPMQAISETVRMYCHSQEALSMTARYRVVLSTCVNAGMFYILQLPREHFSHVFIDEAGQATEPECLIPIGLGANGKIILAGDPRQLGPVLKSAYAIHYGLNISLLERLMSHLDYQRNDELFKEGYNAELVTKLVNNYRSHSAIISLPSQLFYHNELQSCAPMELQEILCEWKHLPTKQFPVLFHTVTGKELREADSPSFFNAAEIVQVAQYVKLLLQDKRISTTDIGIISPYRKQVKKIRIMLQALNVQQLKIGSVEEFQGQERKVIIISTVRSRSVVANDTDTRSTLGFVANAKRFNVAITRAQGLLIVVGNPHVLAQDQYWRAFLDHCNANSAVIAENVS